VCVYIRIITIGNRRSRIRDVKKNFNNNAPFFSSTLFFTRGPSSGPLSDDIIRSCVCVCTFVCIIVTRRSALTDVQLRIVRRRMFIGTGRTFLRGRRLIHRQSSSNNAGAMVRTLFAIRPRGRAKGRERQN